MNQMGRKESTNAGRTGVQLSRDFDFPRESVFRMLTEPHTAAGIWSPEGAVQLVFELEPRPGGTMRIHDRDGDGIVHKTSGTVVDFVAPELLVVQTATAPPNGAAPWEALQTVKFEELSPKKTRVTVTVKVLATGSFPGGVESLEEGFQGGWGEVLDKVRRELR